MADIIATVWDFDKTLIPGYMQQPIFDEFKYDAEEFWSEVNKKIRQYRKEGYEVNGETFYLNQLIEFSAPGQPFDGLNNDILERLGENIEFYEGAVDLFKAIVALGEKDEYKEFGIKFENYIVSTGLLRMIKGSKIFHSNLVKHVWGAELIDEEIDGKKRLASIAYSLDNTSKTRALFEINKGVGLYEGSSIDVNSRIKEEERRIQFANMIYIADGPSDVPAFSVMNVKGGATLAVYPRGDARAFAQADRLLRDQRVQMIAEACYKKDSMTEMWLMNRIEERAKALIDRKKEVFKRPSGTPKFL